MYVVFTGDIWMYVYIYTYTYPAYEFQTYLLYISNLIHKVKLLFQIGPISLSQAVDFLFIYILTNTWHC